MKIEDFELERWLTRHELHVKYDIAESGILPLTLNDLLAFIPKVFVALIIIVLTGAVANAVKGFVSGALSHLSYGGFVTQGMTIAIWVIGGFAALDQIQIAEDIVDTLFTTVVASLGAIMVIKFGVGGIWAARDRFWPAVYDKVSEANDD